MRFGLSLVSYVTEARKEIATRCFNSLSKTDVTGLDHPVLQLWVRPTTFDYWSFSLSEFALRLTPSERPGNVSQQIQWSAEELMSFAMDVTHIVFMYDDFVFNDQWLQQLKGLIERHPDAVAWSVYRSAYIRHHRIIGGDGVDVLMTMHDGLGCMTVQEYARLAQTILDCKGDLTVPDNHPLAGGCTIDVFHAYKHEGERWATTRDYWQNLGTHDHIHGGQDQAIDFVGE